MSQLIGALLPALILFPGGLRPAGTSSAECSLRRAKVIAQTLRNCLDGGDARGPVANGGRTSSRSRRKHCAFVWTGAARRVLSRMVSARPESECEGSCLCLIFQSLEEDRETPSS